MNRSLPELVRDRAQQQPERLAYEFVDDGGVHECTYAQLDERSAAMAAAIAQAVGPGEPVILMAEPGLAFVAALWGALRCGAVAVPVPPPRPGRAERSRPRLEAILRDSGARAVVASAAVRDASSSGLEVGGLRWIVEAPPGADPACEGDVAGADAALLQYTSGSTGRPRGVLVSHAQLVDNSESIRRAFGHSPDSRVVMWTPPHHDMGLVGGVVQPLYVGCPVTLMAPAWFLVRPRRWLEQVSRTRATTSGGPDFGYDLAARKVRLEDAPPLDLSCWEVAFSGAEPVRNATLERFAAAFAPCGFRRQALLPCYGLAEATLFVTGSPRGRGPLSLRVSGEALEQGVVERVSAAAPRARHVVSCGVPDPRTRVAIVDPGSGQACGPARVGEIWVQGPACASGYHGDPEETARRFAARLPGEPGGWLRTGDLGFVEDGELFVTGRLVDVLVVSGRNHHPEDVELTALEAVAPIEPRGAAAFLDDADRLVVLVEADPRRVARGDWDHGAVVPPIRRAVADSHGLRVAEVVVVRPGTLPRTSSGKIARHAARADHAAGRLQGLEGVG